jgi:elongation factor 3
MSTPDAVPACIKALSSTTFVAEVTAPALAVLVPLLIRALNDRSMEVQRRTVVVIDNLVKLVRDPNVAAVHLSPLVEGVQKIAKGAAFPEVRDYYPVIPSLMPILYFQVRAFGDAALKTLLVSGASSTGPPSIRRDVEGQIAEALSTLLTLLPNEMLVISSAHPNGSHTPRQTLLSRSLEFQASLVADLVHARRFTDGRSWNRCVGVYLGLWLEAEEATAFAETVRLHFQAIDQVDHRYFLLFDFDQTDILLVQRCSSPGWIEGRRRSSV